MATDVDLDLAIATAVGTWALVVGTLLLMWWQTRQSQRLNSGNAVITLRERFDTERMRDARRHLASRLLKSQHEDITSMEVVTFFELVGALTHRKLLDEELVWEAFGTWVNAYYKALRSPVDVISTLRNDLKDPLIFREFEWLEERIVAWDLQKLGGAAASRAEDATEVARMIEREATLTEF